MTSAFSLFDDSPKEKFNQDEISNEKKNLDLIFSQNIQNTNIFSFNKKKDNFTYSTTNDKTIQYPKHIKNSENIKEVSDFNLGDNLTPPGNQAKVAPSHEEPMEIEEFNEKDSSMSESPKEKIDPKQKSDKSENYQEEEKDFKFIRRESKNYYSLGTPKFDEDYVIIKTLCEGEMGNVYLCMNFQNKKTYVVKKTNFFARKFDYYNMKNFLDCINNNAANPCTQFLQKYIDFWIEEIENNSSKSGNKNMYIVTEYCLGGDLLEYISKIKKSKFKFDVDFYWDLVFQMLVSVSFLHKLDYVHFDIKPSNFLVKENGQLILSDFCLTINEENIMNFASEDLEGDSIYISPELFYKNKDIINHKTDIFSLGLSIFQILTDIDLPKNGENWTKIRTSGIPDSFLNNITKYGEDNQKFKDLIVSMTNYESSKRPELESILNDKDKYPKLYNKYQQLLNGNYVFKYNLNNWDNFRKDSYDFSSSIGNFKKRFAKRSDSMKSVELTSKK
jgi:serine/threonine protein kinase